MAQCLDVRRERLVANDRILLDTNVVLDVTSPSFGPRESDRQRSYSAFIQTALVARAGIFVSILTLYEIASVLETVVFRRKTGRAHVDRTELKGFRHDLQQRGIVLAEIRTAWQQVTTFADVLDAPLAAPLALRSIQMLERTRLDGYDVPLVLTARIAGITGFVTHDPDYASVDGIIVFTANPALL